LQLGFSVATFCVAVPGTTAYDLQWDAGEHHPARLEGRRLMTVMPLSYEETLAELHGFIWTKVVVFVSHADTEFVVANIVGPLTRASAIDVGGNVPELEGDFAGESMLFEVSDADSPGIVGTFAIWRDGFQWGGGSRCRTPSGSPSRLPGCSFASCPRRSFRRTRPLDGGQAVYVYVHAYRAQQRHTWHA
jgi:hypothetical protein